MTYTVDRLNSAAMAESYARLSQFTQIMCAGDGDRPEFKESNVKRAGGKFATRAEKAKMAEDAAAANMAAFAAAPAGEVQLPDGTKTYKLSKEQSDQVGNAVKGFADFVTNIAKAASTDPGTAVQDLEKQLAGVQADKVAKDIDALSPAAKKALAEKTAPAKAQAAAQVTKAIAANMSDDQVKKGLVAVTKQLNSGEPSKPEQVMEMIKGWAAEAQKNIDGGIKAIKSAGSDAKAKALAAGTGLMTKIAEMAAAARNSDAGKAIGNAASAAGSAIGEGLSNANQIGKDLVIDARQTAKRAEIGIKEAKKGALKTLGNAASGVKSAVGSGASAVGSAVGSAGKTLGDAANSVKKAIGDKVNEAGFSTDVKDLSGDLAQVGKDLVIDGRQTAKRAEIGIKETRKSALKTLGNAANSAGKTLGDAANSAKKSIGEGANSAGDLGKEIGDAYREGAETGRKATAEALAGGGIGSLAGGLNKSISDGAARGQKLAIKVAGKPAPLSQGPANKTNAGIIKPAEPNVKPKYQLGDTANAVRTAIKDGSVGDAIKSTGSGIVGTLGKPVIDAQKTSASALKNLGDAAVNAKAAIKSGAIGDAIKSTGSRVVGTLGKPVIDAYEAPGKAKAAIKGGAIGDAIKSAGSKAVGVIGKPVGDALDARAARILIDGKAEAKRAAALKSAQESARSSAKKERDRINEQALARLARA